MKTPYQILGVKENATQDEIKKAYRNLAKKYHPDVSRGNKQNEMKFKEISNAYDLIGTPDARAKYDRGETDETFSTQKESGKRNQWSSFYDSQYNSGQNGRNHARSFADTFGDEDFFESLFRGGRFHKERNVKNEDTHYQMEVSFADSILGAEKVITLSNGKNLKIKIPKGVTSGTKLRFKGQGQTDNENIPPGDAYVQIIVLPLEGHERNGLDIETELPISFMEAILGSEIEVPTLYGPVMLKIPPGVSTGTKLRIKGKGVVNEEGVGNHIVKLKVVIPKTTNPELLNAIKSWDGKFDYDPRS